MATDKNSQIVSAQTMTHVSESVFIPLHPTSYIIQHNIVVMLDYDEIFDGSGRKSRVNLSTNVASSPSSLLSTVKKERLAREQRRKDERAVLTIQRVWRGRRGTLEARERLVGSLAEGSVAQRARRLVGLYKIGVGRDGAKIRGELMDWVNTAGRVVSESFSQGLS